MARIQELLGRGERFGHEPGRLQEALERFPHRFVIVEDRDFPDLRHACLPGPPQEILHTAATRSTTKRYFCITRWCSSRKTFDPSNGLGSPAAGKSCDEQ